MVKSLGNALDRNFRNNSNDNFTEHENKINALDERVSNIVANAGDSNTEIVDARQAKDGTTYTTLRDHTNAIHDQIGILQTQLGNRISNLSNYTYSSVTDWLNEQELRRLESGVNVKSRMFGAIGDGNSHPLSTKYSTLEEAQVDYPSAQALTDQIDQVAFEKALSFCKNNIAGKVLTLEVPTGTYILNRSLTLFNGLTMKGNGAFANEFDKRTVLKNGSTDFFSFNGSDVTDVVITGIEFWGSSVNINTNFLQTQDQSTGFTLNYSKIYQCAFKFFNYVFNGRVLGVHFYENNINNGTHIMSLAGADSTIRDNFMAVQLNNPASYFMVTLNSMSLSRFDRNFLTGKNSMAISINNCANMEFNNNWWDYTNQSAVYITSSSKLYFNANYYGRNVTAPSGQYSAACVMYDSNNLIFDGEVFYNEGNISQYAVRRSTGSTYRIVIRTPRLDSGAKLNIQTSSSEYDYLSDIDFDCPFSQYKQGTLRLPFYTTGADYFDTQLGKKIYLKTPSLRHNCTYVVSSAATTSGNVTVTLDGTPYNIAVTAGDSAQTVASKIAATTFAGWTVSVFSTQVTFSKNVSGAATTNFSGGSTGVTATLTVNTNGSSMQWVDANGTKVWGQQQAFNVNDKIVTDNNYYQCTVAGITSTTMPTHTTGTATDGTVTWQYLKSIV